MVMNVVFESEKKSLRLVKFNPEETYNLEDLDFYIPSNLRNATPFLLIKDSEGTKDILKMTKTQSGHAYNIYSVSLDNAIKVIDGKSSIIVLVLTNDFMRSAASEIILSYANIKEGMKLNLIESFSNYLTTVYDKVQKLTEMNLEIYKTIEGVSKI
jgi:hypothetical protein